MTTDGKVEPENQNTVQEPEKTIETPENPNQQFLDEMKNMFQTSIKELKDTFEQKKQELDEQIKLKDQEIEKLKQANANLVLTSNFGNNQNGFIDYKSVDFDEVDWEPQAKSYLENIDNNIFDLNNNKKE